MEIIEEFGIGILPLQVNLGDESRFDGVDVMPDEDCMKAETGRLS